MWPELRVAAGYHEPLGGNVTKGGMMNIFDQCGYVLFSRIDALPIGFEGGLADIYGEGWEDTGSSGQRKDYGRQFKEAVESGQITCLEWIGIASSGRHDLYRKIRGL